MIQVTTILLLILLRVCQAARAGATTAMMIQGQSGKFTLYNKDIGFAQDGNKVMVTMDYLHELVAPGDTIVGMTGPPSGRHSVPTFATQTFSVNITEGGDSLYHGLEVDQWVFESPVYNAGVVRVVGLIFREGGSFINEVGETYEVMAGDFKFNVELLGWQWCDPCAEQLSSTHLDIGIEIKGARNSPTEVNNDDDDDDDNGGHHPHGAFEIGDGQRVLLSGGVVVDGTTVVTMDDGYPKVVSDNNKSLFVFRFAKVDGALNYLYDPVIEMSRRSNNPVEDNDRTRPNNSSIVDDAPSFSNSTLLPTNNSSDGSEAENGGSADRVPQSPGRPSNNDVEANGDGMPPRPPNNIESDEIARPNNRPGVESLPNNSSGLPHDNESDRESANKTTLRTGMMIQGQSGKFTLYNKDIGFAQDGNKVMVTMDYLHELVAPGDTIVGMTGPPSGRHSVPTFATQTFSVNMTEGGDSLYHGLEVDQWVFESPVYNAGVVRVVGLIFREGGSFINEVGETYEVMAGDFKFNVELLGWQWCDPCAEQLSSTHLDIGIEIKGARNSPTEVNNNDDDDDDNGGHHPHGAFEIGDGQRVLLSGGVVVDGRTVVTMDDGYPKVVSDNNDKSLFVFRFAKVDGALNYLYDPVIEMSARTASPEDSAADSTPNDNVDGDATPDPPQPTVVETGDSDPSTPLSPTIGNPSDPSSNGVRRNGGFVLGMVHPDGGRMINAMISFVGLLSRLQGLWMALS